MKIKIVQGTYGYVPQEGMAVELINITHDPIEVSESQGQRLLGLGIAEVVEEKGQETDSEPEKEKYEKKESEEKELTFQEMRQLAKQMGISTKGTKEELSARIDEANKKQEKLDAEPDEEQPPMFSPAEPE